MSSFSERLGHARPIVTDAAPQWLRTSVLNGVLKEFIDLIGVRGYSDLDEDRYKVVTLSDLMLEMGIAFQIDVASPPSHSQRALEVFMELLNGLSWINFYGTLELFFTLVRSQSVAFSILYQKMLNELLVKANVAWKLTEHGELSRTLPGDVTALERTLSADDLLINSVKVSLVKARKFLDSRPCDATNAVKESIGALESYSRDKTGAATFGGALKVWKRSDTPIPPLLVSSMEKLYAFASDEAGVRHGSPDDERLIREDAELIYLISLALLHYLRGVE